MPNFDRTTGRSHPRGGRAWGFGALSEGDRERFGPAFELFAPTSEFMRCTRGHRSDGGSEMRCDRQALKLLVLGLCVRVAKMQHRDARMRESVDHGEREQFLPADHSRSGR